MLPVCRSPQNLPLTRVKLIPPTILKYQLLVLIGSKINAGTKFDSSLRKRDHQLSLVTCFQVWAHSQRGNTSAWPSLSVPADIPRNCISMPIVVPSLPAQTSQPSPISGGLRTLHRVFNKNYYSVHCLLTHRDGSLSSFLDRQKKQRCWHFLNRRHHFLGHFQHWSSVEESQYSGKFKWKLRDYHLVNLFLNNWK